LKIRLETFGGNPVGQDDEGLSISFDFLEYEVVEGAHEPGKVFVSLVYVLELVSVLRGKVFPPRPKSLVC
jgi:hypothetical protein